MARKLGMRGGVSLDMTVPANDRYIWDFSCKHCRDRALQIIDQQRQLCLVFSPACMPYSNIQNLNMRMPEGKAKVESARRRGDAHLRVCVTLAQRPVDGGSYFVYEHPKTAASWANPSVDKLASTAGVMRTDLDLCDFGLTSEDKLGRAPAKKPTSLLTNSCGGQQDDGFQVPRGAQTCPLDGRTSLGRGTLPGQVLQVLVQGHEATSQGRRERHDVGVDL